MKEQIEKVKQLLHSAYMQIDRVDVRDTLADATALLDGLITNEAMCENKTCSYYEHYLVYFDPSRTAAGPRLDHEPFHAAERQCTVAQKRVLAWYDENDGNDKQIPPAFERQADYWERRVCA